MVPRVLLVFLLMQATLGELAPDTWPENFIVAHVNSNVSLKCKADHRDVIWKDKNGKVKVEGNTAYNLTFVDEPDAGNYTCWSNGKLLSSVYLFIDDSEHASVSNIYCHAESYLTSRLTCSWNLPPPSPSPSPRPPPKIRVRVERGTSDTKAWTYVQRYKEFEVNFPKACPSEEEHRPFTVILQAIDEEEEKYISVNKTMFLRDIIKPGPPEDVKIQDLKDAIKVNWKYPSTWATPHSYFPLLFQIKQVLPNSTEVEVMVEGEVSRILHSKVKGVCVRCRNLFYNSKWSNWEQGSYTNQTQKEKNYLLEEK